MKHSFLHCLSIAILSFFAFTSVWAENDSIPPDFQNRLNELEKMAEIDTAKYARDVHETMQLGKEAGLNSVVANCYTHIITYFLVHPESDVKRAEAELLNFRQFIEKLESQKDKTQKDNENLAKYTRWFYTMWQNMILILYEDSNILQATMELNNMLQYAKNHNAPYGMSCAYTIFGYFDEEFSYDAAMDNYKLALKYANESGFHEKDYYIYQSMAYTSFYAKRYNETFEYLNKTMAVKHPEKHEQMCDCLRMRAYIMTDRKAEATKYYNKLKQYWDNQDLSPSYIRAVAPAICEYLHKYGDPEESKKYWMFIDNPLETQIEYYKAKGDYAKALELKEQNDSIKAKAHAEKEQAEINNANVFYNTQQLKDENRQLELDNANSRNILYMVVIMALLAILCFGVYIIITAQKHNRELKTERDHVKEERSKAVKLSDMKTTFINNMSHEVRTPLNSIIGFNDLLNQPGMEFTAEERGEMLSHIHEQTDILTRLLDNVIFISRIDGNDLKPETEEMTLKEIVDRAVEVTEEKLNPGVRIDTNCTDAKIQTDRKLMVTALAAILDNAAKFTAEGVITLNASQNEITVTNPGNEIPAESAETIFDRFEKLSSHLSGFGLGLSIARECLRLLGGTVRLDTAHKGGARFVITMR